MCAIHGVYNHAKPAFATYDGLNAQQHRAKEFAGIAVSDGEKINSVVGRGLVKEALPIKLIKKLEGCHAIGHVRYATSGMNGADATQHIYAQPLNGKRGNDHVALVHNGDIKNVEEICGKENIFFSRSNFIDTEVILERFCRHTSGTVIDAVKHAVSGLKGSYCLIFLMGDRMIVMRDCKGNRPLIMGKSGDATYFASETCAFQSLNENITYEREVEPGEIIDINDGEMTSSCLPQTDVNPGKCAFELPYLTSPASTVFGQDVAVFRINLGHKLALLSDIPKDIDIVMSTPDSANYIALGMAEKMGVPYCPGLMRSHYSGRSFIEPTQKDRERHVEEKFIAVRGILKGKKVLIVDDSIVRLTTMPIVVKKLFWGGAQEVHVVIATPPTNNVCEYGIDTPRRAELIAAKHSVDEICAKIKATSLNYIPLNTYKEVFPKSEEYCFNCWEG